MRFRSRRALGAYNFAGDIGKVAVPLVASLLLVALPWRETLSLLGICGLFAGAVIFVLMPRLTAEAPVSKSEKSEGNGGTRMRLAFPLLLSIGVLDSATRMAFLTFLPRLCRRNFSAGRSVVAKLPARTMF